MRFDFGFISHEFYSYTPQKSKINVKNSLFSIAASNKSVMWQGQGVSSPGQRRRTPDGDADR